MNLSSNLTVAELSTLLKAVHEAMSAARQHGIEIRRGDQDQIEAADKIEAIAFRNILDIVYGD